MTSPTPFMERFSENVFLLEKILIISLGFGVILTLSQINTAFIALSLLSLGIIFFLIAYRPVNIPEKENEGFGFSELLALNIVPKVLWLSSAVSSIGLAFFTLELPNEGYKKMLMIGAISIATATFLFLVFLITGIKYLKNVAPVLLRALPLLIADIFILMM
jgi:hypothetical protein